MRSKVEQNGDRDIGGKEVANPNEVGQCYVMSLWVFFFSSTLKLHQYHFDCMISLALKISKYAPR